MNRPTAKPRRWASLKTAAAYADCSVDTIRARIADGSLPGYRSPNRKTIRVDLNEYDAMLAPIPSAAGSGFQQESA